MGSQHHPEAELKNLKWCIVVTSDRVYRGEARDEVTPLARRMIEARGHKVVGAAVTPNSPLHIQYEVLSAIVRGCDVVLVTGGTGPRPVDVSVDAVARLADRELPGIGEAFRAASSRRIGLRAYLSRATAFIVHGSLVVVTPGNPDAVKLMLEEVLLPVVGHILYEMRR